ncbi:hypothetical protein BD289DRAFT_242452 [Coniella lustricola]|uniref:Uncharacterized protein n=1 Tax=Coniella lustricola TaxID=2025994 RepID=A0A2T3A9D7_9PEZI|nr:hypothetical protein BD289DRAFT_242452 [Coniella lustricola]
MPLACWSEVATGPLVCAAKPMRRLSGRIETHLFPSSAHGYVGAVSRLCTARFGTRSLLVLVSPCCFKCARWRQRQSQTRIPLAWTSSRCLCRVCRLTLVVHSPLGFSRTGGSSPKTLNPSHPGKSLDRASAGWCCSSEAHPIQQTYRLDHPLGSIRFSNCFGPFLAYSLHEG